MHVRHRNGPGNGYRPNALGMGGMAAASRISPEGSIRGPRMYNTEYRNNNIRGGYGHGGHSKQSQQLPPRETDIFMEAGRLAAEYLVSKGVLPPNALSGKWQNDDVKNFQGFRQHDPDKTHMSADGRASGHSRLGNASLDVGSGRRRYSDEYNSLGSRFSVRRTGPFKNGGSETRSELGRNGSWVERSGASNSMEADSDTFVGNHAVQPGGKDGNGVTQSSSPGEAIREVDSEALIQSESEKCNTEDDVHANNGALSEVKKLLSDTDGEPLKMSDNANKFYDEVKVPKEDRNENNLQPKHDEKKAKASIKDDTLVSEDHFDLAKHCKFGNVPTKARSSLTKGPKGAQNPMKDGKISNKELLVGSGVQVMDVDIGSSSCNDLSNQDQELKSLPSDALNEPSMDKDLGVAHPIKPEQCLMAGSFPETSAYKEREPDGEKSGFQSPNSMFTEKGVKRELDLTADERGGSKKIKQLVSSVDTQSDGSSSPLSSSIINPLPIKELNTSQSALGSVVSDQKFFDISLPPKCRADSCEFMEEKQLFPGSFKTCDLNLSGTCDVSENHESDPMIIFPSVTHPGQAGAPIDVDLSMSNNDNLPHKNCNHGVKAIDVEVIDLENDSEQDNKALSNPERRADTLFSDLDGLPSNIHNANGIPDVQDGYGLMISELLGNDSRTDLNSLNNSMGLAANTEGMLGDDDSIYMSLGEISLLVPWEQPMQDYGKPF